MEILNNLTSLWGDDLKKKLAPGVRLKIAASCFSIYAYEALKEEFQDIEGLEFIFTAPTFVPDEVSDKLSKQRREFFIPKERREKSLYGSEFEIQLRNKLNQRAIAKECARWIRAKARFRSNGTKSPMQQFACLKGEQEAVYTPIQGFTAVDLGYQSGDAVSNFINCMDEAPMTQSYLQLFDQLWQDNDKLKDVTDVLCSHIESVYQENSPERIYFFILHNLFREFLEDLDEDVLPKELTGYKDSVVWNKLFNFQRDAAIGIINKLETYNGCILADSVGLGKTFTALAVIKYYELRNRSVLVLCPKKLADNWLNYNRNLKTNVLAADRLNYDVLCHTDLQRTKGESLGMPLDRVNWGNYDLVVIDESHNFRNNDAFKDRETRYQRLMNSVIRDGVKTKVLMLSATPVNNRFNDLKNQLALAYEGNSDNLTEKLKTDKDIDDIFRRAQMAFNQWSKLPPEDRTAQAILDSLEFDFFELLDSVTIARSRKHIETFYDTKDIGPFPKRRPPLSFRCPMSLKNDVIEFDEIFERLSMLNLSVYAPTSYVLPSRLSKYEELYDTAAQGGKVRFRQIDRERSLQSLMTANLLKRLESSVSSFRLSLIALKGKHDSILGKIETFRSLGKGSSVESLSEGLERMEAEDDDLLDMELEGVIEGKVKIDMGDMDLLSWENDLRGDVVIIEGLLSEMDKIGPEEDAKLDHLKKLIAQKIANPINSGNRKVLIFSAFADTVNYLYENLAPELWERLEVHTGRITGKDSPKTTVGRGHDFQGILTLFSPISKEKATVMPQEPDEIDVLIATDCISEGQNLQDCDYLINYDIHWNPVRIIQRFGRIDRIGSPNETIQLVNYWPDISLDEYINLKERVENRMVIVDVTATGDDDVLSARANDVMYRKEQLRRLQEEVLDLEDLKTGVNITDMGLNDFRMDLINHIRGKGDLSAIPNGMHAVVPADPQRGLTSGVVFVLKALGKASRDGQNRLYPFYMVYISDKGDILADQTEVKRILDLIRTGCKGKDQPVIALCDRFNRETDDGRDMETYSRLLDGAVRSMAEVKEERDIDSLFSGFTTTALTETIGGLDDFELIAFLVIKEDV